MRWIAEGAGLLLPNITTEAGSALKAKTVAQETTGTIPTQEPILQRVLYLTEVDLTPIQVGVKAQLDLPPHHAVRLIVGVQILEVQEAALLAALVEQRHEAEITKSIQIQSEDDE